MTDQWQIQPTQSMPYPQPLVAVRPGSTTAAAVLGFVQAGLAIAGGLVVVLSLFAVKAADRAGDAGLVAFAAVLQFGLCGVLIHASTRLLRGRSLRLFQAAGAGILALALFYFLIYVERLNELPDNVSTRISTSLSGSFVVPVVFATLAVVALCLAGGRVSRSFCEKSAS